MNKSITFFLNLILIATLLILPPLATAQGLGCPDNPSPSFGAQYQVIQTIPLAPAIPETHSTRTPGTFYENGTELDIQPDWKAIISSTPDGNGALCSDDLLIIQSSAGYIFRHDFRSADRSRIVPLEPRDITGIFTPGRNTIAISLVDLSPEFRSSSPYYLVIIEPTSSTTLPPPVRISTLTPPTSTPTSTPAPSPTSIPKSIPTIAPSPTSTPIPLPASKPPASTSPPHPTSSWSLPPDRVILGLGMIAGALLLGWMLAHRSRLTGVLVIAKLGELWKTIDLSRYGRAVTIGRKGRIKLEDDDADVPDIAARLIAERGPTGQLQIIWQQVEAGLDPSATAYHIRHGHVEVIGPYRLVYENLSEPETKEAYGGIWNEVS